MTYLKTLIAYTLGANHFMKNSLKNFILIFILILSNPIKAQDTLIINNLSKQQTFYINIYTSTENGWEKINKECEEIKPQQKIKIKLNKEHLENELGASIWTNKNDCLTKNRNAIKFSVDVNDPQTINPFQINISDNSAYFGETKIEKEEEIDLKLQKAFTVELKRKYQERIPKLQLQKYKYDPEILKNPLIDKINTLADLYKPSSDKKLQEAQRYVKSIRIQAI